MCAQYDEDSTFHMLNARVSLFCNEKIGDAESIASAIQEAYGDGELSASGYDHLMGIMSEYI